MTATQLVRASAAASLTADAAAARALRRRESSGPVTTDQVSFTAARQHAVGTMVQSRVTAGTSLAALAALAEDTSRATLHTLVSTGRQRHSPRAQKARPGFAHTAATKKTVTGVPQVTRWLDLAAPAQAPVRKEEAPRPAGAAARGTARPPRRHAASCYAPALGNPSSTRTIGPLRDRKITTPHSGINT